MWHLIKTRFCLPMITSRFSPYSNRHWQCRWSVFICKSETVISWNCYFSLSELKKQNDKITDLTLRPTWQKEPHFLNHTQPWIKWYQGGRYHQQWKCLQKKRHVTLIYWNLKSDSYVSENFCQIEIFLNLARKNTMICLFGV